MSSTPRRRSRPKAQTTVPEPTHQQVDRDAADDSGAEANTRNPKDFAEDEGLTASGGDDPTDRVAPGTAESEFSGAPNEAAPRGENDGTANPLQLTSTAAVQKGRKGFAPGVSGNPNGRPIGSKNKTAQFAKGLLEEAAEDIIRILIDMAKGGNLRAIKLCLDRIYPQPRPTPDGFEMPPISSASDLQGAFACLTEALAKGDVDIDTANSLNKLLQFRVNVFVVSEMVDKLIKLEERVDELS